MAAITFGGREACYVPTPKTFALHFARESLSGKEHQIIRAIELKTFGWVDTDGGRKMEDRISITQIMADTGLPKVTVKWCLKNLVEKEILCQKEPGLKNHTATLWTWHERLFTARDDNRDNQLYQTEQGQGVIRDNGLSLNRDNVLSLTGIRDYTSKGKNRDKGLSPQKKRTKEKLKKGNKPLSEARLEAEAKAVDFILHWNQSAAEPEDVSSDKLRGMVMGILKREDRGAMKSAADDFWFVVNSPNHHSYSPKTLPAFLANEFYRKFLPGFKPRKSYLNSTLRDRPKEAPKETASYHRPWVGGGDYEPKAMKNILGGEDENDT